MDNTDAIRIPSIAELEQIADKYQYVLDVEADPDLRKGFWFFSEISNSNVSCVMTDDLRLFSIDIHNARDTILIEVLKEVLDLYVLETDQLKEDIECCYRTNDEIQTDYSRYWVIYRPYPEEDGVLIRYRAFVEDDE